MFANLRGIGGSTILGSGEVALILDVAALVNLVTRGEEDRLTPHKHHTAFSALTNSSTAVQSGR
jgi:two-component system chemotaxis sensor kinase CheA